MNSPNPRKTPLWLKLFFSVLFFVTIPYNIIHYSALDLLWFCDIAIILAFFGLWCESLNEQEPFCYL